MNTQPHVADQYVQDVHPMSTFYQIPESVECFRIRLKPFDRRRGNVLRIYASKVVNLKAQEANGWYEYDPTNPVDVVKVRHACQVTQVGRTISECIRARMVGPLTRIPAFDVAFSVTQQREFERRHKMAFDPVPDRGTIDSPNRPERIDPAAPAGHPAGYRVPRNAVGQLQNVQGVAHAGVQCVPVFRQDGSLMYVPTDQLSAHVGVSATSGAEVVMPGARDRTSESTGGIQVAVSPEAKKRPGHEPREGRRAAPPAPEKLAAPESVFQDAEEHGDPPAPPMSRPGQKVNGNGGKAKGKNGDGKSAEEHRATEAKRKRNARALKKAEREAAKAAEEEAAESEADDDGPADDSTDQSDDAPAG